MNYHLSNAIRKKLFSTSVCLWPENNFFTEQYNNAIIANNKFSNEVSMAQYKKEYIRSSILASAVRLFIEKGIHETRMTDIAKATGISVGNLYRYFPNKESLVETLCPSTLAEDIKAQLISIFKVAEQTTAEKLFHHTGWLDLKTRFDQYLFDNMTAILIAFGRCDYYEAFKQELTQTLVQLVMVQVPQCSQNSQAVTEPIMVRAMSMIYVSLLDMTLEVFRGRSTLEEKKTMLQIINSYHLNGILSFSKAP